jgi:hypothetical protein
MAVAIPSLPAASAAQLTDLIEVSQGGVSKKETLQQVADLIGGGGDFQPNGGELTHDFNASGDLVLTNPAPTLIFLGNASAPGHFVQFPAMNASNSWPAGTTAIRIYNNSGQSIILKNNGGTNLYTLLDDYSVEVNVISNSTANGSLGILPFGEAATKGVTNNALTNVVGMSSTSTTNNLASFFDTSGSIKDSGVAATNILLKSNNLSDVASLATTQTNLQITGTQNTPLFFMPTNTSGGVAGQTEFAAGVNIPYLQFPDAATSYSYAIAQMPKRWNQSTFQLLFSWYTPATTGNVVFKADAALIQLGSSLNLTFGTAVSSTSPAAGTANAPTNIFTSAITASGVPLDWSWIVVRIYRDGTSGSDTLTNNAFIINPVRLWWTASAGNDS